MNTEKLEKGQTVYIYEINRIVKAKIQTIYSSGIGVSIETKQGFQMLITYCWYLSLEEAINSFINNTNKRHNTNFKITKG